MRRVGPLLAAVTLSAIGCGSSTPAELATTGPPSVEPTPAAFCDAARAVEQTQLRFVARGAATMADIKAGFAEYNRANDRFISTAPAALRVDVRVSVYEDRKMIADAIQRVADNRVTDSESTQSPGYTPEYLAASERVGAYLRQVCHLGTSTASTP